MIFKRFLSTIFIFTIFSSAYAFGVLPDKRGPVKELEAENNPEMIELLRVRIENILDGKITVSADEGKTWSPIGKVLLAAGYLNKEGYTASGWAQNGRVAATAVNAVHIKVRQNKDRGVMLSVLPFEMYSPPANYKSYYSKNTSVITDIPAGTGFFGGDESPFVGSPVFLEKTDGKIIPLPEDFYPAEGDIYVIRIDRPVRYPSEIEFENRFGGFITATFHDGEKKIIGQVLKPVYGVGRFDGSMYTDVGRIRANHTGVICISTSVPGLKGGFQILPDNHGMSPEMRTARLLTQWMVVGPPSVMDPSTEGVAPLFKYFLRPTYHPATADRSIEDALASFIVQVKMNNGEWERMPALDGRLDEALEFMTNVRILFPLDTPDWIKVK